MTALQVRDSHVVSVSAEEWGQLTQFSVCISGCRLDVMRFDQSGSKGVID